MRKLALLLALLISPAFAQDRPVGNWLADDANLLQSSEEQRILEQIHRVESAKGVRLAVVTLSSISEDPKTVAVNTINSWQLGPRSALLLISLNPRKIYIQPGNAYAEVLTEMVCTEIATERIAPHLKQSAWATGIESGLSSIEQALLPQVEATGQPATTGGWPLVFVTAPVAAALTVFALFRSKGSSPYDSPFTPLKSSYYDDQPAKLAKKAGKKKAAKKTSSYSDSSSTGGSSYSPPAHTDMMTGYVLGSSSSSSSSDDDHRRTYDSPSSSFDYGSTSSFDCSGGGGGGSDF